MKAICINNSGYANLLSQGQQYDVTFVSDVAVIVAGVPHPTWSLGWRATRFQIVTSVPKLDLTKPVQTRDGRPVRILCSDAPGDWCIVGLIGEKVLSWQANGQYSTLRESQADLVNVPPKPAEQTAEVILYRTAKGRVILTIANGTTFGSSAKDRVLGRKTVTITEGEGMGGCKCSPNECKCQNCN